MTMSWWMEWFLNCTFFSLHIHFKHFYRLKSGPLIRMHSYSGGRGCFTWSLCLTMCTLITQHQGQFGVHIKAAGTNWASTQPCSCGSKFTSFTCDQVWITRPTIYKRQLLDVSWVVFCSQMSNSESKPNSCVTNATSSIWQLQYFGPWTALFDCL